MLLFDERFQTFSAFSFAHGIAISLLLLIVGILFAHRNKISATNDVLIRRIMVLMMLLLEWTFYGWTMMTRGFDTGLLPFGMCALTLYITSYALWTKSEKVFRFIFPWALAGALLSLVIADTSYTFPHFRFIHYFANHSLFLLANLYMFWVLRFTFTYRDLLRSSFYLGVYAVIVYPINFLLNANHLFLRELPTEVAPLYEVFGDFWVFGFAFSIFLLFHIVCAPLYVAYKLRSRSSSEESIIEA